MQRQAYGHNHLRARDICVVLLSPWHQGMDSHIGMMFQGTAQMQPTTISCHVVALFTEDSVGSQPDVHQGASGSGKDAHTA